MNLHWAMLLLAIAASMGGQALLKAGAGTPDFLEQLFDYRTIIGLGLYGGAAMVYIVALRRIPLSVALPCSAVSYVAAMAIGHFVFGEAIGPLRIGAMVLICAGVVMLAAA